MAELIYRNVKNLPAVESKDDMNESDAIIVVQDETTKQASFADVRDAIIDIIGPESIGADPEGSANAALTAAKNYAKTYTDDEISKLDAALSEDIADNASAIQTLSDNTDASIEALTKNVTDNYATKVENAQTLTDAKSYTDSEISSLDAKLTESISANASGIQTLATDVATNYATKVENAQTLTDAKSYTDSEISTLNISLSADIADNASDIQALAKNVTDNYATKVENNQSLTDAKTYTDEEISTLNTSLSADITALSTNVTTNYATKVENAQSLTDAKAYTDSEISSLDTSLSADIQDLSTNVATNYATKTENAKSLTDAKAYTDSEISTLNTSLSADISSNATAIQNLSTNVTNNYVKKTDTIGKATADASGNVITTTYATKTENAQSLTDAKAYTDDEISKLIGTAPDTLDTLGEISEALKNNAGIVDSIIAQIPTKVSQLTNDSAYITKNSDITGTAAKATADSSGQQIDSTYIKKISLIATHNISTGERGSAFQLTKGDNTTSSIEIPDKNVTNTLATTTKAYVTGTTSATTNTGTQVFDTGVYLDTTAGKLVATTFAGALSGNASTASKLATARTIALTGSVTGSGSFDGSGNLSIATSFAGDLPGNASTATKATQDSAGQQITTTYIKDLKASGTTLTITKGDGSTSTITTQDTNTDTKVTNTLATTTKAYVTGTTSATTNTGTQVFDTGVYLDTTAGSLVATTFKGALSGNASTATKATQDSAGQQINTTYIKGLSVSGTTVTVTKGDGSTSTITTQDTNTDTKVTNTLATTTKAYVTGTTSATTNTGTQVFDTGVYLDTTAGMLTATTFKGALSGNASTATKATQDSAGQQINTTYIKGISASGQTLTITKGDGSTSTITTQDTNTDTKVTNTLATTTKAYLTGTTSATTNTGTQVFDTGVYLETTAGRLYASSFNEGGTLLSTKYRYWREALVGQNSNTGLAKPYYKFASLSTTRTNYDGGITFKVSTYYSVQDNSTIVGILTAHFRTNSSGYWSSGELKWEYAASGVDTSKFILAHNTSTSPTVVELWACVDVGWRFYHFDVISEGTRNSTNNSLWTLYNTYADGSAEAITAGYTQIASTLSTLKNPILGNASTATKLATARTIALTGSVTGSGTFDGSGNLSIATTTNHTHSYLPLAGGDMTGTINSSKTASTILAGNQGAAIINSTASPESYTMLAKMNSTHGYFTMGMHQANYLLLYTEKSTVDAETNSVTKSATLLDESGNTSFPGTVSAGVLNGVLYTSGNRTSFVNNQFTAGEALAVNDLIILDASTGTWFKSTTARTYAGVAMVATARATCASGATVYANVGMQHTVTAATVGSLAAHNLVLIRGTLGDDGVSFTTDGTITNTRIEGKEYIRAGYLQSATSIILSGMNPQILTWGSGGGTIDTDSVVTIDTAQTVSGSKTFSGTNYVTGKMQQSGAFTDYTTYRFRNTAMGTSSTPTTDATYGGSGSIYIQYS